MTGIVIASTGRYLQLTKRMMPDLTNASATIAQVVTKAAQHVLLARSDTDWPPCHLLYISTTVDATSRFDY
jgi:hypothetical protein